MGKLEDLESEIRDLKDQVRALWRLSGLPCPLFDRHGCADWERCDFCTEYKEHDWVPGVGKKKHRHCSACYKEEA